LKWRKGVSLSGIYNQCTKLKSKAGYEDWFNAYNKRIDRCTPSFLSKAPRNGDAHFVMFGHRRKISNFR